MWQFRLSIAVLVVLGLSSAMPHAAQAHAFFQRYALPIPLVHYLVGAGATVAVSFVLVAWFLRARDEGGAYPRANLLNYGFGRVLAHPASVFLYRLVSVGIFLLLVAAGLFGVDSPFKNLVPTFVWVIWWIGLAYLCTLLGNIWALVNPWNALFHWAESLLRRLRPEARLSLGLSYPRWLGVWPAWVLFWLFAWMEIVWPGTDHPRDMAGVILAYSAITWGCMVVFGRDRWLQSGEAFTVIFSLMARFAPTEIRVINRAHCGTCASGQCRGERADCVNCQACYRRAAPAEREWNLRPFAVGLLTREAVPPSLMAFVLLLLSTVTFDGFRETPFWLEIQDWMLSEPALRGVLIWLRDLSGDLTLVFPTAALAVFPVLFLAVFFLFSWLMRAAVGSAAAAPGVWGLARLFVLTLMPIAIAYHLAHYIWFLMVAGQFIIPLASDPFGYGWDLFGTALYQVDVAVGGARFIWITAVAAIVAGHVIAVYLAHVMALRVFVDRRAAISSQYPMLLLMVGYTMISLWILAQPIVQPG